MSTPITLKINVSRIDKKHLYAGKNGTYLDVVIFPNRNGTDQYGNTHTVFQSIPKEARDAGERGPIIGNAKLPDQQEQWSARPQRPPQPHKDQHYESDDIPF
jgi:hypothetical protein